MKRAHKYFLLAFIFSGCNTTLDITNSSGNYTNYIKGQIYEVRKPVFLFKSQKNDPSEIPSLANLGFGGTADNLPEFRQRVSGAPQVAGLLMPGDLVQVFKIYKENSFEMGEYINVFAVIKSEHLNSVVVSLNLISKKGLYDSTIRVDPDQLVLVK